MAAAADSSQRIALEAAGTLPVFEALVELPAAQTSSIELSRLVALQSELESMAGAVAERQQELANHLASLTQLHAQRFASAPSTYPRRSVVSVQASPTKGGAGRLAKNSRKRARLSTDSVDLPSTAEVMPVEAPPHPFWVGIEEYFREPTQAEIDALAARAQDTTPAPELMIVPPLGRHYLELWKEQEYIRQADSNATNSARFSAKPLQVAEPSGGPLAERLAASLLDHATTRPSHKHFLQHLPSHVNPPVPAEQRSRQLESELKQQLVALGILSETDDGEEIAGDEAPSTSVRRACSGRGSGVGRSGSGSCDSPQDEILAELRTVQRDYQAQLLECSNLFQELYHKSQSRLQDQGRAKLKQLQQACEEADRKVEQLYFKRLSLQKRQQTPPASFTEQIVAALRARKDARQQYVAHRRQMGL
eukprot:m.84390 g.84390  ORF g.84390 m.84390 type:complete len:422 (+) comp8344_c0_seq3:7-1272(+)